MPVTKKKVEASEMPSQMASPTEVPHKEQGCIGSCMSHHGMSPKNHCGHFGRKLLMTFVGILFVYLTVYVGVRIQNEIKAYEFIGVADKSERLITVEAEASVDVAPNIASVQMGLRSEAATVAEAQAQNTEKMNVFITRLNALGVPAEDIQTSNYKMSPEYDWTQTEGEELVGYSVFQNVTIKLRNVGTDLDLSKQVLGLAGEVGIINVGNFEYTIDEKDSYLAQAREEALKKVAKKVASLSQALGVRMKQVVGYNEYEVGTGDAYYGNYKEAMMSDVGAVPDLQPGTNTVTLHVSVTFEIR